MIERSEAGRQLSWKLYLLVVLVYLAIIQVGGLLLGSGLDYERGTLPDSEVVLRVAVVPIGLSLLFGILVTSRLGWRREVLKDDIAVQRWVRIVPIALLVTSLITLDYANVLDQKVSLVLSLLLMVALVGCGEELMFRGIGVTSFRREGFTEGKVALYTSLIFGFVHLSNALTTGATAIGQAIIVSFAGYFLYLSRRVGGGLWLPILVHASWDFGLLSSSIGADETAYPLTAVAIVTLIGLGILLWRRRDRIEVEPG